MLNVAERPKTNFTHISVPKEHVNINKKNEENDIYIDYKKLKVKKIRGEEKNNKKTIEMCLRELLDFYKRYYRKKCLINLDCIPKKLKLTPFQVYERVKSKSMTTIQKNPSNNNNLNALKNRKFLEIRKTPTTNSCEYFHYFTDKDKNKEDINKNISSLFTTFNNLSLLSPSKVLNKKLSFVKYFSRKKSCIWSEEVSKEKEKENTIYTSFLHDSSNFFIRNSFIVPSILKKCESTKISSKINYHNKKLKIIGNESSSSQLNFKNCKSYRDLRSKLFSRNKINVANKSISSSISLSSGKNEMSKILPKIMKNNFSSTNNNFNYNYSSNNVLIDKNIPSTCSNFFITDNFKLFMSLSNNIKDDKDKNL